MKVGKDSVVMGNVPANVEVGDRSVVVGPTHGTDTILNTPMAVGHNASAAPDSIAIGAGASAGFNLPAAVHQLTRLAQQANDSIALGHLTQISSGLAKPQPNRSIILKAWEGVKAAGSLNGAHGLLVKIAAVLGLS